jgi:hypothetical protein
MVETEKTLFNFVDLIATRQNQQNHFNADPCGSGSETLLRIKRTRTGGKYGTSTYYRRKRGAYFM